MRWRPPGSGDYETIAPQFFRPPDRALGGAPVSAILRETLLPVEPWRGDGRGQRFFPNGDGDMMQSE